MSQYDVNYCATPCNYYVGVYGYRSNGSFGILVSASNDSVTQLVDGQPVVSAVQQSSTEQFVLYVTPGTPTIVVSVVLWCG